MCKSHLTGAVSYQKQQIIKQLTQMNLFCEILQTTTKWSSWQEIAKEEPVKLIRQLIKSRYYKLSRKAAQVLPILAREERRE